MAKKPKANPFAKIGQAASVANPKARPSSPTATRKPFKGKK